MYKRSRKTSITLCVSLSILVLSTKSVIGFLQVLSSESSPCFRKQCDQATLKLGRKSLHVHTASEKDTNRVNQTSILTDSSRIEFRDFWGTKLRKGGDDDEFKLPCDPSLDLYDGSLPYGSYMIYGNSENDPKSTCRVTLSLDWQQRNSKFELLPLNEKNVIRQIFQCVDAGFQTFQLSSGCQDNDMIGRIVQATPDFVEMHWIVHFEVPSIITTTTVREVVFDLISKTRSESLDTLIIPHDASIAPQYYFEILDALKDMQRDGYIRCVGVADWPCELLEQAQKYDFEIDVHQRSGNLLNPPSLDSYPIHCVQSLSNPLADWFLSDRVYGIRDPPVDVDGWKNVELWHERVYGNQETKDQKQDSSFYHKVWNTYIDEMYDSLYKLSLKHEVNIESIAMRWILQNGTSEDTKKSASNVIYPLFLMDEPVGKLRREIRRLRDVFRFELDSEDIAILDKMVRRPKPKPKTVFIDEVEVAIAEVPPEFLEEFEAMNSKDEFSRREENADEYPEIDFSNQALWL